MADEHDTSDPDDTAAPDAVRTVDGDEPLDWPLRLAMYVVVAVVWYGVYSDWGLTGDILDGSPLPIKCLFIAIVVVYQFLLELSLRRWPKVSQNNAIAVIMPAFGAAGFLATFIMADRVLAGMQAGGQMPTFGVSDIPFILLLGIPAYYVFTAPVTIPGALATAWLVRRYAPVPPKPPPEDFDAY